MGYWPYKKLFEEFRPNDCDIFVETGTYKGDSVQDALDLGFKVVISVEKNKTFYQECFKRFNGLDIWGYRPTQDPNLYLFHGDSSELMPNLLEKVNGKALFWLDAHENGKVIPTINEIDYILKDKRNDHTIIIDDMDLVEYSISLNDLKSKFLEKNSDYKFKNMKVSTAQQLIIYT